MYRDLGFIRVEGRSRGIARAERRPSRRDPALRLPALPAQADRGLRARRRPIAERVLRGVPRPQRARRSPAAGLRRRAGQVDGAHLRREPLIGHANMHLLGRQVDPAADPARPLAPVGVGAPAPGRPAEAAARERRSPRAAAGSSSRARPRARARLPEGHRLRRGGLCSARSSASPTPGPRRCPATSTCAASPSG